nr:hypothetical protein [bacterium]
FLFLFIFNDLADLTSGYVRLYASEYYEKEFNIYNLLAESLQSETGNLVKLHIKISCANPEIRNNTKVVEFRVPKLTNKQDVPAETEFLKNQLSEKEKQFVKLQSDLQEKTNELFEVKTKLTVKEEIIKNLKDQINNPPTLTNTLLQSVLESKRNNGDSEKTMEMLKEQYKLQIKSLEDEKRDLKDEINRLKDKIDELLEENTELKINVSQSSSGNSNWMPVIEKLTESFAPAIPLLLSSFSNQSKKEAAAPSAAAGSAAGNSQEILLNELKEILKSIKTCMSENMSAEEIKNIIETAHPGFIDRQIKPYLVKDKENAKKILFSLAVKECGYIDADIDKLKGFVDIL